MRWDVSHFDCSCHCTDCHFPLHIANLRNRRNSIKRFASVNVCKFVCVQTLALMLLNCCLHWLMPIDDNRLLQWQKMAKSWWQMDVDRRTKWTVHGDKSLCSNHNHCVCVCVCDTMTVLKLLFIAYNAYIHIMPWYDRYLCVLCLLHIYTLDWTWTATAAGYLSRSIYIRRT